MTSANKSGAWKAHLHLAVVATCLLLIPPASARRTEAEPTLATSDLVKGRVVLSGNGYTTSPRTPVIDYMGRFQVQTDIGTVEAVGTEEFIQRINELPAARRLMALERSDAFGSAIAASAKNTGEAVVRIVTHPVDTLAGLPAGIGRTLSSAGRRARSLALRVADSGRHDDGTIESASTSEPAEKDSAATDPAIDFVEELASVNKARRQIARDLGIDPYSRNPLISEKLGQLAWAWAAGGLSVDLAMSAASSGIRTALSTATTVDALAWELPPVDIRYRLERQLVTRGHGGFESRDFLRNPAFTPTDQLAFVELLTRLDAADGEQRVVDLARAVKRPRHAQFMIRQLRLLVAMHSTQPIVSIHGTDGILWAVSKRGEPILPLAIDHLSWNGDLANAIERSGALARTRGVVLVTGSVSRLAASRLRSLGWDAHPNSPMSTD